MNPTEEPEVHSESDDSDDADQPQDVSTSKARKIRSTRACVACRRMKTRCEVDEALGSACKLCIRGRRQCIMQAIPRRRKRKTTERVADLEEKINALTALLETKDGSRAGGEGPPLPEHYSPLRLRDTSLDEIDKPSTTLIADALDRGLLDWATCCEAFDKFKNDMCRYFPFVMFPATTDAMAVKEQQPILFFAIVTVALVTMQTKVDSELADMLTKDLALRIMYRGERSLEIVQTLLVQISFYARGKHMRELNFNQMARKPNVPTLTSSNHLRAEELGLDAIIQQLVSQCLYVILHFFVGLFEPPASPTDVWLCDLIRLQHIAEDASIVFSMDDPGSVVTFRDMKTQYQMGGFRQQLDHWRRYARTNLKLPYVRQVVASTELFIHEIALLSDHNIDELSPVRAPSTGTAIDALASSLGDLHFVPARVESLFVCLAAIHENFEALLSMDLVAICTLPNLFFVRTGYAARALRKLLNICANQVHLAEKLRFNIRDLKFDEYLDSIVDLLAKVHTQTNSQVARAFCMVLKQIKTQGLGSLKLHCGAQGADDSSYINMGGDTGSLPAAMLTDTSNSSANAQANTTIQETHQPSVYNTFDETITVSNQQQTMNPPLNALFQADGSLGPAAEAGDSFMTGFDMLQWFGQDFGFDETGMYADDMNFHSTAGTWE